MNKLIIVVSLALGLTACVVENPLKLMKVADKECSLVDVSNIFLEDNSAHTLYVIQKCETDGTITPQELHEEIVLAN